MTENAVVRDSIRGGNNGLGWGEKVLLFLFNNIQSTIKIQLFILSDNRDNKVIQCQAYSLVMFSC